MPHAKGAEGATVWNGLVAKTATHLRASHCSRSYEAEFQAGTRSRVPEFHIKLGRSFVFESRSSRCSRSGLRGELMVGSIRADGRGFAGETSGVHGL